MFDNANGKPRSGWITQTDQPKAAAVAAQRVGDIVTRGSEPHIYQELDSGGTFEADEKLVWRPQSLEESNDKTGDWQMMTPAMSAECEAFGANDTVGITRSVARMRSWPRSTPMSAAPLSTGR